MDISQITKYANSLFTFETVDMLDKIEVNSSSIGLAFVPDIIGTYKNKEAAKRILLNAARIGLIELRPDGGLGRFSQNELDLAPPGPQGSYLLWVRII